MAGVREMIETYPVQFGMTNKHPSEVARVPATVSLRAYEVYCHLYSPQEAMVTVGCRGGFTVGEIVCFLYAHSFPKAEWRKRFQEASYGMTLR